MTNPALMPAPEFTPAHAAILMDDVAQQLGGVDAARTMSNQPLPAPFTIRLRLAQSVPNMIEDVVSGCLLDLVDVLIKDGSADLVARPDVAAGRAEHAIVAAGFSAEDLDEKLRSALRAAGFDIKQGPRFCHDEVPVAGVATATVSQAGGGVMSSPAGAP